MIIDRTIAPPISDIKSFNIIKAQKTSLSNGVPLYQIHSENTELVKIEFMFEAGNWFQSSPLTAFAVNHLLIEGSQKYTSAEIADMVEYYGAFLGYNLDKDFAYISVFTMSKYLPEVLILLENIIKGPVFPEHEVAQFKTKHKQQFLIEQTKLRNIARSVSARMIYGNAHPYGYMIVEDDFDNISREGITEFYRQFYSSARCTIIASGAITDEDIILIDKYFGKESWNNTIAVKDINYRVLPETERKIYIERPDAVQNAIRISKEMFSKKHTDYIPLSIVNCILGGYFGSRLMKSIREDKGYTYGINSLFITLLHSGYISIASELNTNVTAQAVKEIYNEIEILRTVLITESELARVKNYMLGELVRMFDGPFTQAESLISLLEYNFGYDYYYKYIETIKSITPEQVLSLSEKYLDPSSFYEVVVGRIDG